VLDPDFLMTLTDGNRRKTEKKLFKKEVFELAK